MSTRVGNTWITTTPPLRRAARPPSDVLATKRMPRESMRRLVGLPEVRRARLSPYFLRDTLALIGLVVVVAAVVALVEWSPLAGFGAAVGIAALAWAAVRA